MKSSLSSAALVDSQGTPFSDLSFSGMCGLDQGKIIKKLFTDNLEIFFTVKRQLTKTNINIRKISLRLTIRVKSKQQRNNRFLKLKEQLKGKSNLFPKKRNWKVKQYTYVALKFMSSGKNTKVLQI